MNKNIVFIIYFSSLMLILVLFSTYITTNYKILILQRVTTEDYQQKNFTSPLQCRYGEEDVYCEFPKGDYSLFIPTGQSMFPFMMGEKEALLCENNFTLQEQHIYAYSNPQLTDTRIVHRCKQLTPTGCMFKGDNNDFLENISTENIICEVRWLIREIN